MPRVKFDDGISINFDSMPSQSDIDEAYEFAKSSRGATQEVSKPEWQGKGIVGNTLTAFQRPGAAVRAALMGKDPVAGFKRPNEVPSFMDTFGEAATSKMPLPRNPIQSLVDFGVGASGRTLGMVADVATDPVTYLTAGVAKGGQMLGKAVPEIGSAISKVSTPISAFLNKSRALPKIPSQAEKLTKDISNTFNKAIKPLVKGKQRLAQRNNYYKQAEDAVIDIAQNKPGGELPKTVSDFASASKTRMDDLFTEWSNLEKVTGETSYRPNLKPAIEKLQKEFATNPAYNIRPGMQEYADRLSRQLASTPNDIGTLSQQVKILNKSAAGHYLDPASIGQSQIDAEAVKWLRETLDETINKATGKNWQALRTKYASHRAIERDLNNAVIREAKKLNPGGLSDLLGTFGDAETVAGLITANPQLILRGVTQKASLGFMKWINDPNGLVKNMFLKAEKVAGKPSLTPEVIMPGERIPTRARPALQSAESQKLLPDKSMPKIASEYTYGKDFRMRNPRFADYIRNKKIKPEQLKDRSLLDALWKEFNG